jgi:hypothetical protein
LVKGRNPLAQLYRGAVGKVVTDRGLARNQAYKDGFPQRNR